MKQPSKPIRLSLRFETPNPRMTSGFLSLTLLLILSSVSCSGGGGGGGSALPPPIEVRHPIDGVVDLDSLPGVREETLTLREDLGTGGAVRDTNLRWSFLNDDRSLYLAVEWTDADHDNRFDRETGPVDFDGVKVLFDNDGDGNYDLGEDARTVIAASIRSQYIDQHKTTAGEDETDLIGDGFGVLLYDPAQTRYRGEFLLPLEPDARGDDGTLSAATRFNFVLFDHVEIGPETGNVGFAFGEGSDSSLWPTLPMTSANRHDHPEIPQDLEGLIAFVSTHEEALGEIYTFTPETKSVRRVTHRPDLEKDNVSLSHDRTRVSFHGATDPADPNTLEIFVADVATGTITQLTDNRITDGHPAWSPDDSQIAYSSFRGPGGAQIVLMTDTGAEIGVLTPPEIDANDADFLPDGRIVFKTDLFSASPEVRIAVMNPDGTGIVQLTHTSGVSDHDPVATDSFAYFERFNKDTPFQLDVEAGFTPWDLLEVPLDGASERPVFSDGWINWLPLPDPSRRFLLHLKSSGSTDAHLLTLDGRPLGRFIPDQTRIRYIDWK